MARPSAAGQLSWLLDNLVGRVQPIQQALVLSRDGLVVAASQNLGKCLTAPPRFHDHEPVAG